MTTTTLSTSSWLSHLLPKTNVTTLNTFSKVWVNGHALKEASTTKEVHGFSFCPTEVSGVYLDKHNLTVPFDELDLHPVGRTVLSTPNGGFSDGSLLSEAYSAHRLASYLDFSFGCVVADVKTEGELEYKYRSALTDYSLYFRETLFGVNKLAVEANAPHPERGQVP